MEVRPHLRNKGRRLLPAGELVRRFRFRGGCSRDMGCLESLQILSKRGQKFVCDVDLQRLCESLTEVRSGLFRSPRQNVRNKGRRPRLHLSVFHSRSLIYARVFRCGDDLLYDTAEECTPWACEALETVRQRGGSFLRVSIQSILLQIS